jgi:hypothetical protein
LRPKGFDLERSFEVLEFFLKHSLDDFLESLDRAEVPAGAEEADSGGRPLLVAQTQRR